MTGGLERFDVVVLVRGLPDHGLPAGTEAVILDIDDEQPVRYEIEVC